MTAAIQIEQVSKQFKAFTALNGVSLTIEAGEFFALLGPNGAGKTTLINILSGLSRATHGHVAIMGHDTVQDYRAARRVLGVVPQELVFDPFFTVRECLEIQSGYFGLHRNGAWIDELLENLGLSHKANSNMRALSGGMKRRVLVAQALVHRPPVIVLDEPTAGVDVELRQSLWAFVQRLNRAGHTILLTTHYLEEAETLCGRVAMLKQGKIIALDKTANLLEAFGKKVAYFRLAGSLPEALHALLQRAQGDEYWLELPDYGHLEGVLHALRTAGVSVLDMALKQTDLEQVFVRLMQKN